MNSNTKNLTETNDKPWNTPWPKSELEILTQCPVCTNATSTNLYDNLVDNVFFVANGKWTLQCCNECRSGFLNPRPTPESIGNAYGVYYTHLESSKRVNDCDLQGYRYLRRLLANGYTNQKYGTKRFPSAKLGYWVALLFGNLRQEFAVAYRYLPKPTTNQRLLDVGCGNGEFLLSAQDAGWDVMGVEPDPKAAEVALRNNLNVLVGGIDLFDNQREIFDAITMSHVIEHVHNPRKLLFDSWRLLKPGGIIYVDTPNICSLGAKKFGINWRGLEIPRHLVLFNVDSLSSLLMEFGFVEIDIKRRTSISLAMYASSMAMVLGKSPYESDYSMLSIFERIKLKLRYLKTRELEFVTLTAIKHTI